MTSKFKVGDRVKHCANSSPGVVVGVHENRMHPIRVLFEWGTISAGGDYCAERNLTLLEDPTLEIDSPGHAMNYSNTSEARKEMPIYRGVVRYCPAALALVSKLSLAGNRKHNPGQEELTHARDKSGDHGDALLRHQMEIGHIDPEAKLDYAVHVAWRALMQLQEIAEQQYGWPVAPAAKWETKK